MDRLFFFLAVLIVGNAAQLRFDSMGRPIFDSQPPPPDQRSFQPNPAQRGPDPRQPPPPPPPPVQDARPIAMPTDGQPRPAQDPARQPPQPQPQPVQDILRQPPQAPQPSAAQQPVQPQLPNPQQPPQQPFQGLPPPNQDARRPPFQAPQPQPQQGPQQQPQQPQPQQGPQQQPQQPQPQKIPQQPQPRPEQLPQQQQVQPRPQQLSQPQQPPQQPPQPPLRPPQLPQQPPQQPLRQPPPNPAFPLPVVNPRFDVLNSSRIRVQGFQPVIDNRRSVRSIPDETENEEPEAADDFKKFKSTPDLDVSNFDKLDTGDVNDEGSGEVSTITMQTSPLPILDEDRIEGDADSDEVSPTTDTPYEFPESADYWARVNDDLGSSIFDNNARVVESEDGGSPDGGDTVTLVTVISEDETDADPVDLVEDVTQPSDLSETSDDDEDSKDVIGDSKSRSRVSESLDEDDQDGKESDGEVDSTTEEPNETSPTVESDDGDSSDQDTDGQSVSPDNLDENEDSTTETTAGRLDEDQVSTPDGSETEDNLDVSFRNREEGRSDDTDSSDQRTDEQPSEDIQDEIDPSLLDVDEPPAVHSAERPESTPVDGSETADEQDDSRQEVTQKPVPVEVKHTGKHHSHDHHFKSTESPQHSPDRHHHKNITSNITQVNPASKSHTASVVSFIRKNIIAVVALILGIPVTVVLFYFLYVKRLRRFTGSLNVTPANFGHKKHTVTFARDSRRHSTPGKTSCTEENELSYSPTTSGKVPPPPIIPPPPYTTVCKKSIP